MKRASNRPRMKDAPDHPRMKETSNHLSMKRASDQKPIHSSPHSHTYLPGQRWISEMEPELGLGTVTTIDSRTVAVHFKITQCTRNYAVASAPLKRVRFSPGDRITLKDDTSATIETVEEMDGLIHYRITRAGQAKNGKEFQEEQRIICETDLSGSLVFSAPEERLDAGLSDPPEWFDLRYDILCARNRYHKSDVMGFMGPRVELIPHQFHIAKEVASRHAPRVLLADETGLGKTIEACLILNRLLLTERISRVLILVPNALIHQWFVELYRRFQLSFRIMDDDHWNTFLIQGDQGKRESGISMNPFLDDQLFICDMEWMISNGKREACCIEAGWDMVVVDEAHHVDAYGPGYDFLARLTDLTVKSDTGLMLLTATPEQLGEQRHFAHLKLLDPKRYTTLSQYRQESQSYGKLADRLDALRQKNQSSRNRQNNKSNKNDISNKNNIESAKEIDTILDCYGPGRAVFRNTRKGITGFPKRRGILYPLREKISINLFGKDKTHEAHSHTKSEEAILGQVIDFGITSERIGWLIDLLKRFSSEKFLLISHTATRTVEIAEALNQRIRLNIALFNEKMTLLQRDRSAAWWGNPNIRATRGHLRI